MLCLIHNPNRRVVLFHIRQNIGIPRPHNLDAIDKTQKLEPVQGFNQKKYAGAMYSGCGGGYLFVVSQETVPGAFHAQVHLGKEQGSTL